MTMNSEVYRIKDNKWKIFSWCCYWTNKSKGL